MALADFKESKTTSIASNATVKLNFENSSPIPKCFQPVFIIKITSSSIVAKAILKWEKLSKNHCKSFCCQSVVEYNYCLQFFSDCDANCYPLPLH